MEQCRGPQYEENKKDGKILGEHTKHLTNCIQERITIIEQLFRFPLIVAVSHNLLPVILLVDPCLPGFPGLLEVHSVEELREQDEVARVHR